MPYTNAGVARCYKGGFLEPDVYRALHTASPPTAANELTGGGYARKQLLPAQWTIQDNQAKLNVRADDAESNASQGDPAVVGYWSAANGGDLLAYENLAVDIDEVTSGVQTYSLPDDLVLTIPLS